MAIEDIEFSEILVARLCHDLAAPIGVVFNGVELFEEANSKDFQQHALGLISLNSKISINRLKFFRYIYGPGYKNRDSNLDELRNLVQEFLEDKKYSIVWDIKTTVSKHVQLSHISARLMLILIYIASELLIKEGKIIVNIENLTNGIHVYVKGEGNNIKDPNYIIEILEHNAGQSAIKVENVLIYIADRLALNIKTKIGFQFEPNYFSLEFQIPQNTD